METPGFNKIEAFQKQKALLKAKRDRLDRLLDLLDRLEKGETCMSFKEFDLSEYLHILEQFRNENMEEVIRHWGSVEEFDQLMERIKDHESSIAQDAIKYYGSVEAYVEAMKDSMEHFSENMEKMEQIKEKGYVERNQILIEQLLKDLSKDPGSKEIQDIIGQMMNLLDEEDKPDMDLGENYWDVMIDSYLHNSALIENMDKKYGKGASVFMGKALSCYMETSGKCHRKTREL